MRHIVSVALVLTTSFFGGCTTAPPITQPEEVRGFLENTDLKIAAEDGSFTLNPGQAFTISSELHGQCGAPGDDPSLQDGLVSPECYKQMGGRPVRVKFSGSKKELYGLLKFNTKHPRLNDIRDSVKYYPAAVSSHSIKISQNTLDGALAGRTTAAYEVYADVTTRDGPFLIGGTHSWSLISWQLLLSNKPF